MASEPILIVDDNPANLKLARLLLTAEGHDARTAPDAEQAMKLLETFTPKLILMDIQLPGMDGLSLTRQLKTDPALANVPIIALTAYAMKGDDEKALASGCAGYITKPIDTRSFARQVAEFMAPPRNASP
jgi:CheY-like chemotaxis protein